MLQTLPLVYPAKYKPISNSCDLTLQFLPLFSEKIIVFGADLVKLGRFEHLPKIDWKKYSSWPFVQKSFEDGHEVLHLGHSAKAHAE